MIESKPDIVLVIESEGIDLRRFKGLCPFHEEKTPSFTVNPSKQYYHCFGCGAHGDVVDFIKKRRGCSFKEALIILGIAPGRPQPVNPAIARAKALKKAFEQWRRETYLDLCDERIEIEHLRLCAERKKPLDENLAWFMAEQLAKLPQIECQLDILSGSDDEAKFDLLEAVG